LLIEEIYLKNIKAYDEKAIVFSPPQGSFITAITGPNGVGKTTILESIIYVIRGFVYGHGPNSFMRKGSQNGFVRIAFRSIEVKGSGIRHEAEAYLSLTDGSRIYLDGRETTRELIRKYIDSFWFFPQDIELVIGSDEERRNYLDKVIRAAEPNLKRIFSSYQTALISRNQLLQSQKNQDAYKSAELDAVEEVLSQLAAEITLRRQEFVHEINLKLEEIRNEFSGIDDIRIKYRPAVNLSTPFLKESFMENLYVSRGTDITTCTTSVGPHRDTIKVEFKGRDARYEASYGERKLIAFLLKLAGFKVLLKKSSAGIVFLADDVFSELDLERKKLIFNILKSIQSHVIFTATEIPAALLKNSEMEVVNLD